MPRDEIANEQFLTIEQVAARYNASTDSIYRWKREGDFSDFILCCKRGRQAQHPREPTF